MKSDCEYRQTLGRVFWKSAEIIVHIMRQVIIQKKVENFDADEKLLADSEMAGCCFDFEELMNDGIALYRDMGRSRDAFRLFCEQGMNNGNPTAVADISASIAHSFIEWQDVTGRVLRLFEKMRREYESRGFDMARHAELQQLFHDHCGNAQSSEIACDLRIARLTGVPVLSVSQQADLQSQQRRLGFWASQKAEFTRADMDAIESLRSEHAGSTVAPKAAPQATL